MQKYYQVMSGYINAKFSFNKLNYLKLLSTFASLISILKDHFIIELDDYAITKSQLKYTKYYLKYVIKNTLDILLSTIGKTFYRYPCWFDATWMGSVEKSIDIINRLIQNIFDQISTGLVIPLNKIPHKVELSV